MDGVFSRRRIFLGFRQPRWRQRALRQAVRQPEGSGGCNAAMVEEEEKQGDDDRPLGPLRFFCRCRRRERAGFSGGFQEVGGGSAGCGRKLVRNFRKSTCQEAKIPPIGGERLDGVRIVRQFSDLRCSGSSAARGPVGLLEAKHDAYRPPRRRREVGAAATPSDGADTSARRATLEDEVAILTARLDDLLAAIDDKRDSHQHRLLRAVASLVTHRR